MKHPATGSCLIKDATTPSWFARTFARRTWGGLALVSGMSVVAWAFDALPTFFDEPPISAATKARYATKPEKPTAATPEMNEAKVKLNYFSASWEKVFLDLANAYDMEFIADQLPSGRLSRRDKTEYSRKDAMRVINKEIASQGFRLIEKGTFLILIDIPSGRQEYQPAVLTKEQPPKKDDQKPEELAAKPNQFRANLIKNSPDNEINTAVHQASTNDESRIKPKLLRRTTAASAADEAELSTAARRDDRSDRVRQTSHDEFFPEPEVAPVRRPHPMETELPAALEGIGAAAPSQAVYRGRHLRGTELAKRVYQALKSSAELIEAGRQGLPAFRVASRQSDPMNTGMPDVEFMVSIDEARNELLVDARSRESANGVIKLLKALDRPDEGQLPAQIKTSTKYVCQIADQLPVEIERIRAARGSNPVARHPVDGRPLWLADDAERRVPAADTDADEPSPAARGPAADDGGALGDALSNLAGEVNIEVVEDLNVLIIRGNAADVEQVMKVIRRLEKLGEATAPQIELRHLRNVDAESLAELMTTVYEKLTKFPGKGTQPRQNVAIIPVSKPNSLLIIAPKADLESILSLADDLDKPVDPQTEFQVFRLKSAIASQVETLITEFYKERKSLGAKVLVISDARANAVIVRAQARDLDEIQSLIRKVDRDETSAVSQVRIFPLKNAVATELSAVINSSIQSVLSPPSNSSGGGAGAQGGPTPGLSSGQVEEQFKTVKSAVLQFLTVEKGTSRQVRSGILSDIRITPDSRANSLIVTASEQSMELIAALVKSMDRPTSTVSVIKVFTLANADADQMVQQLNSLFNSQQQGGNQARQQQQLGIAIANADDASSSLVPMKFSVDTRTNSVIAIGSADALGVVEAIMLRLDDSDLRARKNTVYRLRNSPAAAAANTITQFFQSQRELAQQDPNLISNVEQLEREVITIADVTTNSLLISSTPRFYESVLAMIKKLDEAPRQVVIQALIVEVQLNNTDEFGMELGFQSPVLYNRSLINTLQTISQTSTPVGQPQVTNQVVLSKDTIPGFNFNNSGLPLGNNAGASNAGAVGLQSLSNYSLGRSNGDLGFGGLVLSAGSDTINLLLRALASNRKIQILSRPQIRALDNQQAEVFVGQTIPTVTSFQTNAQTGVISPTLTQRETGIGMQVIPRINDDGQIVMQMYAYRSQLSKETVTVTTDSRGQAVGQRITDLSNVRTTVSVPSNSTVVIGGMISSRDEAFTRKAPFLGDIPIIGQAFRYDSRTVLRTELLIFLTPRILNGPQEEECLKEIEIGRIHFIESEAEEVHGPLRSIPAEELFEEDSTPWIGPDVPSTIHPTPADPTYPRPVQAPTPQFNPLLIPHSDLPPAPAPSGSSSSGKPILDPNLSQISLSRLQATESDQAESDRATTGNARVPSQTFPSKAVLKKSVSANVKPRSNSMLPRGSERRN